MAKSEWGGREHVLSPFDLFLINKCRVGCENLYCTILEWKELTLCGCSVVYDENITLEEMYSVNMQSSLCRSSPPKVVIIYTTVLLQCCSWPAMCDRVPKAQ